MWSIDDDDNGNDKFEHVAALNRSSSFIFEASLAEYMLHKMIFTRGTGKTGGYLRLAYCNRIALSK